RGRLGATNNLCDRLGIGLQILVGIVVDRLAGLGIDALGPGDLADVLRGLQELSAEPIEAVGKAIARSANDSLAVLAVDPGIDQDVTAGLVIVHRVVGRVLV